MLSSMNYTLCIVGCGKRTIFKNTRFIKLEIIYFIRSDHVVTTGVTASQRHSILVETPSSTSSDADFTNKKLEEEVRKRPKVKVRRKCLRTQSTSELPQLGNGGLTKGIRKVHSSSSFCRMTSLEEPNLKVT